MRNLTDIPRAVMYSKVVSFPNYGRRFYKDSLMVTKYNVILFAKLCNLQNSMALRLDASVTVNDESPGIFV